MGVIVESPEFWKLREIVNKNRYIRNCCHFAVMIFVVALAACTVNPVTGQSEIELVSTAQQIQIGQQQYVPAQQMQGGQYKVDPALSEYVAGVGARLAAQSPAKLPYEFVVLNNSVPNAWALPGGKIAINRGLLVELRNEAELAAVLGHEIVHAAARHGAKSMERGLLLQSAVMATQIGSDRVPLGDTLVRSVQTGASLINQKYGRDAERESDFYGTRYLAQAGYDPYAAVTLQETFVRLSQGGGGAAQQRSWMDGLFASHPPSEERVTNNRGLVEQLREEGYRDGEYGADRYQAAIRTIKTDAPAYAQLDLARQAVFEGDYAEAVGHVEQAIAAQNEEAQFHAMRGEIRARQGRYQDAITNFDRALARDSEFFSFYLGRGMANARLDRPEEAQQDLNRSLQLLPTTIAYLELGKVAESQGNLEAATRYYEAAGQSPGEIGQEARSSLLRVDLPNRPERYLSSQTGVGEDGRWLLRVMNNSPVAVTSVRVRVDYIDAGGSTRRFERTIDKLEPGKYRQLQFPREAGSVQRARAEVIAATPTR